MKKYSLLMIFISIISFFSFSLSKAQTLDELIEEGDKYYAEFDNEKALEVFNKANDLYPENWKVLYRISRAYVDIGEHMPAETSEEEDAQLLTYEKALDFADRAVKLDSTQSVNYLRRAIANGRIALFKGVFSVAGVVDAVKEDCEKAIALGNGGNKIQGVSHYVYARTHDKISQKWAPARAILGLGWADIDIAIEEYKKAIEIYPNFLMFYLDFAKAYIEEDEYELAREMLNKAINCPVEDEDDENRREESRQLLIEIEDE